MKKLLNTLFVTTQGAYLCKEGETVCVRVSGEDRLRLPIHTIGGIVCFGQVSCSPFLLGHCAENHVAVSFMTENGRFLARVQGPVSGNVLLRREQYRRADDPAATTAMARSVLTAKIANSRTVLLRAARDHGDKTDSSILEKATEILSRILAKMNGSLSLDELRGFEGEAARTYFGAFNECITVDRDSFFFHERSRRPPLDNMNALLSFLYTLLAHDVSAALEGVGLDPAVGFLHRDRPGRPGLGAGHHGGVQAVPRGSSGIVPRQPPPDQRQGVPEDGVGSCADVGRDAERSHRRLAEAQAGGNQAPIH